MSTHKETHEDEIITFDSDKRLVQVTGDLDVNELAVHAFTLLFREYTWNKLTKPQQKESDVVANDTVDEREIRSSLYKLIDESRRLNSSDREHVLQIRSVPVPDFAFMLRHYFVRVDEIIDIHPGNEQRVCLRGWYSSTDVGSDHLHGQYNLCVDCLDVALKDLWKTAKRFNFAFRNCDHSCNRSCQSIGIAMTIFILIESVCLLVIDGAIILTLLLLFALALSYTLIYVSQTITSIRFISMIGYNPCVKSGSIVRKYRCCHLNKLEDKFMKKK